MLRQSGLSLTEETQLIMENPIKEIHESLIKYFDALYLGDVERFTELFHPRACLFCNTANEFTAMTVAEYLDVVAKRRSPADRGDPREDRILEISVPTATTAHARVQELFLPKRFTDELTFMRSDSGWKIISKVWHYDLVPDRSIAN